MRIGMLISALTVLGFTISWDAPTINCATCCGADAGTPLTDLDHYEIPIFRAVITKWATCVDEGVSYPCPIYSRTITWMRTPTDEPFLSLALPGLGEVVGWLEPEAVDHDGNSSADCPAAPAGLAVTP